MKLKNATGAMSRLGLTVILDPKNPSAFVYSTPDSNNIIGIIGEEVPDNNLCEIITSGTTRVFVSNTAIQGSVIRAQKSADHISRGFCKTANNTDTSFFRIGTSLEQGRGLIRCSISLSYSGTTGAIADGTYTMGLGVSTDGVIVVKDGVIVSLTEAT